MLETLSANNIKITPLGSDKEMLNKTIYKSDTLWAIEFNLSWDNSWKSNNPKNHDAAWIFAKYSLDGSTWAPIDFDIFFPSMFFITIFCLEFSVLTKPPARLM